MFAGVLRSLNNKMFSKQDELKIFSIKIVQCHHQMNSNFLCSQMQGPGKGTALLIFYKPTQNPDGKAGVGLETPG